MVISTSVHLQYKLSYLDVSDVLVAISTSVQYKLSYLEVSDVLVVIFCYDICQRIVSCLGCNGYTQLFKVNSLATAQGNI